jgi:hypothetical protein
MSLSARSNIYAVLRLNTNNTYLQNPCHFEECKFQEWLDDSGLSPDKQKLMRDLSLHEKGYINFYDGQLLEWMTPDPEDRKHIAKAMTRYPTIVMKVHLTPQSDLAALERYWAQGTRGQRMRPFLESLAKVPQGISMSVSFFFPTFARMRLYSYPDMRNPELAHRKNCFYTAMNFFNEVPDLNFLNGSVVVARLQSDYSQVTTNFLFGDLMVFGNDRELIHMCVYIADDVVFTKNGANFLAPWVLMKRTEMLKEFTDFEPMKMAVYRKKNI